MCGRFTQRDSQLPGLEDALCNPGEAGVVRYNGAPSQDFWVIRRHPETGAHHCDRLIWGLVPSWRKDAGGQKPINARSETADSLPTFRGAYAKRRCLIPADSFFEWRRLTAPKQPYAIARMDGARLAFAGLWETWRHPETGRYLRTFCILTRPAEGPIARIHDRMPVIVTPGDFEHWLCSADAVGDLTSDHGESLKIWPVSLAVNSPKNDSASLLDDVSSASDELGGHDADASRIERDALYDRVNANALGQTQLFE